MKQPNKELNIIQETEKLLKGYGDTEIVYYSAEFAPFSNQFRPDLKYKPKNINNRLYFIEYKSEPSKGIDQQYIESIIEHKSFITNESKLEVVYVFATDGLINNNFIKLLNNKKIECFYSVNSASILFEKIIQLQNRNNY
jgi:hypothetical protein